MTPLHLSCQFGNINLSEFLLKQGADKTIEDNNWKEPISYAIEGGYKKIVDLLCFDKLIGIKKSNYQEAFYQTTKKGKRLLILHSLKKGALINKKEFMLETQKFDEKLKN